MVVAPEKRPGSEGRAAEGERDTFGRLYRFLSIRVIKCGIVAIIPHDEITAPGVIYLGFQSPMKSRIVG